MILSVHNEGCLRNASCALNLKSTFLFFQKLNEPHRWCNCLCVHLECGRPWL